MSNSELHNTEHLAMAPSLVKKAVVRCIRKRVVPFIAGSPGIGKSDIIRGIAKEFGLKVIDVRLSQCDPTDLLGLPMVNPETDRAGYKPLDVFPLEGDPLPEGYNGWILFLDEANSAAKSVEAASYKVALEKEIGHRKLHSKCAVVMAGNLATDNAIVNELGTAMQSRLIHLQMKLDFEEWLDWASQAGIDHRVRSYISYCPTSLHQFDPQHSDRTFACPRTWEFASKLIEDRDKLDNEDQLLLAGTVSEGVAREFMGFCRIYQDLPQIDQICKDPENTPLSSDPATMYAVCGTIGAHAHKDNVNALMRYVLRMPLEFQIITLRDLVKRDDELRNASEVREWIRTNARELI